ncbi:hypothetical protein CASFOL_035607 [Castilleja foliolosa]|uniref:X8 domain-containing protein n=1 Tax=Castilleja foliolosa TaxID=1961234 RepID=A0ABD3BVG8_9LAMI
MAKINLSLFFLGCLLSATCVFATRPNYFDQKQAADWCVAQPSAPEDKLQAFIDYACGVTDCGPISLGGPCYDPNTKQGHASWALDAVYKKDGGSCNTDIGNLTTTDPLMEVANIHECEEIFKKNGGLVENK